MIWMSYLWEELGIFSCSHCSSLCLYILQLWSSRVNFTFHERLPYCNCDLCKCHHGFSLNVKKSDAIRKPAAVYVPLKKWDWLWSPSLVRNSESLSSPIHSIFFCHRHHSVDWELFCRATPGAGLGTPWEWKGYLQTPTNKPTYKNKQTYADKHIYSDKQTYPDTETDRQTYVSSGDGSNSMQASLLETLATFITPV